jgi:hypothetical protein
MTIFFHSLCALMSVSFEKSNDISSFVKKYLFSFIINLDSGIFIFEILNIGFFNDISFISQFIIKFLSKKLFKFILLLFRPKDTSSFDILCVLIG